MFVSNVNNKVLIELNYASFIYEIILLWTKNSKRIMHYKRVLYKKFLHDDIHISYREINKYKLY